MEQLQASPVIASESQLTPEGINQWNWGAFFLGFIWGAPHRVWISLLGIIPIVSLVIPFYLGAKGNELAWKAKQWESVEVFHRTQKHWAIAAVVMVMIGGLLFFGVGLLYLWNLNQAIQNAAYSVLRFDEMLPV